MSFRPIFSSWSSSLISSTAPSPNFDRSPAALGPASRSLGGELDADAGGGLDAHLVGHLEQHLELGELLEHDHHRVAELLAHQRQPHELLVLVAVADDEVVGALVEAENGLELRLAAAFETHAVGRAEFHDFLHDVPLLVHLDGIDRRVRSAITEFLDGGVEFGGQRVNAGTKDVGEAEKEWKARPPARSNPSPAGRGRVRASDWRRDAR